jgi:hypothetical protein
MNRGERRRDWHGRDGGRHQEQRDADANLGPSWRLYRAQVWKACSPAQQTAIEGAQDVYEATLAANPAVPFAADE